MIKYPLTSERDRIGFIHKRDLNGTFKLNENLLPYADVMVIFPERSNLTDDPGGTNATLCTVEAGTVGKLIYFRSDYACVELEPGTATDEGVRIEKKIRGYIQYQRIKTVQ